MNNNQDLNENVKKALAVILMLIGHAIPITLSIVGLLIRIIWEIFISYPFFVSREWMKVVETKILEFINYAIDERGNCDEDN